MAEWFVAQVKPNGDKIAKRNLERQGFITFQPLEKRTVAKGGRFHEQIRPFFSGYLFVRYPASVAPWSLVNSTYGVSRLVKFGERPAPVPPEVIAELRAACDAQGIIALSPDIRPGTTVEIRHGTFSSFVGQVERLAPDQRVMVLLDFMGKQTKVNVPTSHLRAASGRTKHSGEYQ
jgi:transcriptional antiterminator RfaH